MATVNMDGLLLHHKGYAAALSNPLQDEVEIWQWYDGNISLISSWSHPCELRGKYIDPLSYHTTFETIIN